MAQLEGIDQFLLSVGRESWDVFKRDALMFVIASLVLMAVSMVTLGILAGPVTVGAIEMIRRAKRGEPLALGILFSRFDTFVPSLIAVVLVGTAIFIGCLLLVLPGLLVALFTPFVMHVLAYESAGGIGAIRRSVELVRDNFLPVFALLIVLGIGQAVGGIVVFGVLLTAPLTLIALTVCYERITGLSRASVPEVLTV